jgi:four helix bundle protein
MFVEGILNRNKNINRSFRKLEVWKLTIALFKYEFELFSNNKFDLILKSHILDFSFSVPSNSAEEHSRRSEIEIVRFIKIVLSLLAENYSQMCAIFNSGIIDNYIFDRFDNKDYELENKLIKFVKLLIDKSMHDEDWRIDY